ncbi:spermine transporter [Kwoniella heveanensis BCC8398]|uniref:Spermine transporter n=1 Tax=Kwoniella heveanensis BCC8398 TaxID=1296120 RepID=A0A1B9H1X0_9TREE|nr:spermine transporter [Kwoniella heveanensis BCC8398]
MLEPIEAEFARPPIYTAEQEEALRDEDVESPGALSPAGLERHRTQLSRVASTHLTRVGTHTPDSAEAEKGKGEILVEFQEGEGPRNWPKAKKWVATMSTSLLCLTVALGSAMPTGDLPGTAEGLHVSDEAIYISITLFVVGFGVGPLIFAPMSEIIGRKPIYCISMFFYFIFTLPSCLAKNIATMLAGRMLAGIASSAPMTNVGGTISDIWAVEDRGIPMAVFSCAIFMGPCLGPLFGGWIGQRTHSWRWIYWVLFILVGVVFAATLVMPETLGVVILKKRATKLNRAHKTNRYVTAHQKLHAASGVTFGQTLKTALIRPFILMFLEPIVLFMSFYLSFVYALLYATFFAFPIAFEEIRGWSPGMTGVAFVSIIVGIFIALFLMPIQEKLYARKPGCPESRLYPMMLGAIFLPVSLFIIAFTGAYARVHWMGMMVGGAIFGFCMVSVYISANSYIVDSYADVAASAVAAKTLMRSLIGASVPLWITQLFHNLGFQYAGLFLALVSVCIGFIPYIFFFKGASIRNGSKRAMKS